MGSPTPTFRARFASAELIRWGCLGAFALWLAHPFLTSRLIGSGDAWWYGNMLRDFLTQLRHGVFPVWIGQTEFAFNGAVYPLRAAPYHQYLGGLLDLVTGRRLDAFTLQHGTLVVSLLLTVALAYWSLCRLAPERRNVAAVLAALYVACPAVLGLATSMDLYMSVMALPFLPLVTCGLALSLRDGGWPAQRMIVVGLALAWYAHAPLAAWLTLIAAGVQGVRLLLHWRERRVWQETLGGALLLAGLVAAVFASVASLRGADTASLVPYAIDRAKIIAALREAFPGSLLPVRMPAVNLSDLQLGYGLWAVLLAGGVGALRPGRRRFLLLAAPAALLVVMLLPIPGLTAWLWHVIPESLARLTYYWPMHRLCPVLAALTLPLGMLALSALGEYRRLLGAVGTLAVLWAAHEAAVMVATAEVRTALVAQSALDRRPENAPLMNHAYGLSLKLPPYFSNGVMDPWFELRVFGGGREVEDNAARVLAKSDAPWGELHTEMDPNPGVWDLAPSLTLQPGRRQLLEFDFGRQEYAGTLQIEGDAFFRQYRLPASGQAQAFGSEPTMPHWIPLWTTSDRPEEIHVRFIPDPGTAALPPPVFARYRWRVVDPRSLPLRIESYAPLRLTVALAQPGLLETFRMYFPGYRATVDGRPAPVVPSANRLAAVEVPAGTHEIEIDYRPPWTLRLAGVLSLCTAAALVLSVGRDWRRRAG